MLNVKKLALTIDGKNIFENVSFRADAGKILLIKGASGSGKSSLLQVLARVIPYAYHGNIEGQATLGDIDILSMSMSEIAGSIGYLMQDPDSQITSHESFDELIFGPENFNKSRAEIDMIATELIDLFMLENIINKDTNQLSGGQKQRLMLASIVAINPEIYLLDEPTANLDPKSTQEIISIIDYLAHEKGKTVILVEHKLANFARIIDEVYDLETGLTLTSQVEEYLLRYSKQFELPEVIHTYSDEVLIDVKNIRYSYGENHPLFADINFKVYKGEILGLVGENGVGKSTLANLLSGFTKIQDGNISFDGKSLEDFTLKEIGQKIGLVFQNPEQQFVKLTVQEEFNISLRNRDFSEKEKQTLIDDNLAKFKLEKYKKANPFQLSQGQKRKLSTALMLVQGQDFLILDEPTYGQDPANLISLMELLIEVSRTGVAILIISHDEELLKKCCHNVIEIKNQTLNFCGESKEYFQIKEADNDSI